MGAEDKAERSYEEAYERLEKIVARLEEDEPPLEQLVRDYEEGMRLLRSCHGKLNEAALRIEKVRSDAELSLEPFDAGEEDREDSGS